MNKVRVYEVAKDLGLPNRELIEKAASLGIQVRNHMSALEPAEVDRVKRAFSKGSQEAVVEERIRPTVVRRRAKKPKDEESAAAADVDASSDAPAPAAVAPAEVAPVATPVVVEAKPVAPVPVAQAPAAEPPKAEAAPAKADVIPEPAKPKAEAQPAKVAEPKVAAPVVAEAAPAKAAPAAESMPEAQPAAPVAVAAGVEAVGESGGDERPSEFPRRGPGSVAERLGGSALPPGVVSRGNQQVGGNGPVRTLSAEARRRIVEEHAQRSTPRRREVTRGALGPAGRAPGGGGGGPGVGGPQSRRPGRRKLAPGKKGKQTEITVPSAQKRVIRIEGEVQLQTLAGRMSLKATDVLMKLMQLGMSGVHINSTLDLDTAKILAGEFGYEVENVARSTEDLVQAARGPFEDLAEDHTGRPPIVTVMGHVDHGKTSLLDKIRSARVAAREAGGITQHIGAYRVEDKKGTIVFLDTPGHEAFTSMRARGAHVTDIVILVVAANDGVMPQTKEAINHAKAAEVPIIVAINKCDLPDAKPDNVRHELVGYGLQPEDWGGDTMMVECSAHTGAGIDQILDGILLQAEMLELTANETIPAEGTVLETYLDRGKGPVANVLVRNGILRTGDNVVVGSAWGRVRAMTDDRGKQLRQAEPATPVEVLGLSDIPSVGDNLYVVTDAKKAQEVADVARQVSRAARPGGPQALSLDQIQELMRKGEVAELNLVIKADVQGSVEALGKALNDLSTDKVKVNIIHTGVGGITENDVMLASASGAIIIGFSVRPAGQAGATAKKENVDIRMYKIIYEAVDEVKLAMAGLLAPKLVEKDLGKAQVREVFTIPKIGAIAGCYVQDGKIVRNGKARLVRDSVVVWEGGLGSLRRFKDDVREVTNGYECGIGLAGYNDLKEGDIIECFEVQEVAATLD